MGVISNIISPVSKGQRWVGGGLRKSGGEGKKVRHSVIK